jgi:hypothetical protein
MSQASAKLNSEEPPEARVQAKESTS